MELGFRVTMHAALEESDIEGEKVLSTDSDERIGEDDDQMTESTQDESYSQESEPTSEELSDDANNDEVPTDVIDMCQQKLIDEHGWSVGEHLIGPHSRSRFWQLYRSVETASKMH